jgi:hypothetical protein
MPTDLSEVQAPQPDMLQCLMASCVLHAAKHTHSNVSFPCLCALDKVADKAGMEGDRGALPGKKTAVGEEQKGTSLLIHMSDGGCSEDLPSFYLRAHV